MAKETWEAKIADSISGILFIKARKRGRGPWLEYDALPQRVKDYLALERLPGRAGHVIITGIRNIDELEDITDHDDNDRLTLRRGNQAMLWFSVDSAPSRERAGEGILRIPSEIGSLRDLMEYFGAEHVMSLNRQIYRNTDCGASISVRTPDGVWHHSGDDWSDIEEITAFKIQTIVEGSDAEVNSNVFELPVTVSEVDNWMAEMEAEADRLWHEANDDENSQNEANDEEEDPPSVKNWRPE
jgi:hypothetical protein